MRLPARGWISADPRSLGLGRIALGVALLLDLLRRAPELTLFYTNVGLLPNHTVLWQPTVRRLLSLFFTVSLPHEAVLAFAASAFCFLALTVGFRTRLFHALSLLATLSLHNRVIFIEGPGSTALGALCLWTLFLPLGRRFSVDAVTGSLRDHPDQTAADLDAARFLPADNTPVPSLAVAGLLLQLVAMLGLGFANRQGATWSDGTALHYGLHQDRIVTWLGVWAREHWPQSMLRACSAVVLWLPLVIAVLVVMPVLRVTARRLAMGSLVALVIVQTSLVNLGSWGLALLAYVPFLMTARDWEWLSARARHRTITRLVFYDGDCGICFQSARILRRMDRLGRLVVVPNDDTSLFPPGFSIDPALLEKTILVVDPASGRRWTQAQAFAEMFRVLPGAAPLAVFMRLPLVRTVAGRVYDRIAVNRTRISTWLGLAACGVPVRPAPPSLTRPATTETTGSGSPICRGWRWLRGKKSQTRELLAAFTLLALGSDALAANPALTTALRDLRPDWVATLVGYTGLQQAWTFWAPDPPLGDRMVFVDALTSDGRHVDPFNAAGSRVHELPVTAIPARLGQSALFAAYAARIPERFVYHQAFLEWVMRQPGRSGDQIVSFDAWVIDDDSPPPGETVARVARPRLFLHHPPPP
jgi:predicted DCC family thiol-disulfide oxidoreductase YuxK